jgi:hypothetical protein
LPFFNRIKIEQIETVCNVLFTTLDSIHSLTVQGVPGMAAATSTEQAP